MSSDNKEYNFDTSELAKNPVAKFFMSGWSHIVRLMGTNALFLIFNIPAIVIAYALATFLLPALIPSFNLEGFIQIALEGGTTEVSYQLYLLMLILFVTFLVSSLLICVGPFQAGFQQVYRDIRNGVSFSLFGSFKAGVKDNWKKSLVMMFIGIIVAAVCLLAISFYMNMNSTFGTVIGTVFVVLLFAFILIQNFAYELLISTDLKLGQIYKNSFLFLLIRFVPCLGVAAIVIVFYLLIPFFLLMSASFLTLGIFIFLYTFIVISWVQYFMSAFAGKLIDRYVAEANDEELENIEENSDNTIE